VRLIEQDYALHTDPKAVDALHESVDALAALAASLKSQSAANVPVMTDVEQALAALNRHIEVARSRMLAD